MKKILIENIKFMIEEQMNEENKTYEDVSLGIIKMLLDSVQRSNELLITTFGDEYKPAYDMWEMFISRLVEKEDSSSVLQ